MVQATKNISEMFWMCEELRKRLIRIYIFNVLEGINYNMTVLWVEGRIEVAARQGRRRKQLRYNLKQIEYWELKGEVLVRTIWRTRFGKGYRPVVRQTAEWWMNEWMNEWVNECSVMAPALNLFLWIVHSLPNKCGLVPQFCNVKILHMGNVVIYRFIDYTVLLR
jgi:hypothetical protein